MKALRIILAAALFALGLKLWWVVGRHEGVTGWAVAGLLVAVIVGCIPAMRDPVAALLDRVRHPLPSARRWTALAVALACMAYTLLTALGQHRDLIPKFHDEHMHLLQIRMLAHGKLWTAEHPLADFFETFHVLVKPVYASIYFPGTALVYAPSIWLGLKFWMLPLVVAGACCALTYLIVTTLLDGVAGLLAALMLVSLKWFRYLALMTMSHSVMLLLGLLMIWAWLNWRREHKIRWAAAIGAFAGLAAITRPVDALCYAVPVGMAMLIGMRRDSIKRIAQTVAVIVLCALPFLAIQIIENMGITGKPLTTPYRVYCDLFTPQMSFGFHRFDPTIRPQTNLLQRQVYYDDFTVPVAKLHTPKNMLSMWVTLRFPLMAKATTPNRLMLFLVPLAALAMTRPERWVLAGVLMLYVGFYAVFAYLLPWYSIVIAPVSILLVLWGKEAVENLASPAWRRSAEVGFVLGIAALSISALPEFDHEALDDPYPSPTHAPSMWFSYVVMPEKVQTPAIVLFRYSPIKNMVHEEPVYNIDVVNPDDAPIIRAHDLGVQKDRELFDYYARRQPRRTVYLYDRASRTLAPLGNVAELAQRLPLTRPATSATTQAATTTSSP